MNRMQTEAENAGGALAEAIYEVYEDSFDKLTQMEEFLFYLSEILDSIQFMEVIQILQDALSLPLQECHEPYNEDTTEWYMVCFLCGFEDALLRIGFERHCTQP